MKPFLFFSILFFQVTVQAQVTITDNYSNTNNFIDLSKLHVWGSGPFPIGTSAFQLTNRTAGTITYPSVSLTADGLANSGYVSSNSLKTATSIDYQFPSVANRTLSDITIEFDAVWSATSGSGESGRLVVFLLTNYPAAGPQVNDIDNVSAAHPFGLPAYNIRLRNNTPSNMPLMLYGGGTSVPGEFEKQGAPATWWLPGFATDAGGVSPGTAADYPVGATKIGNGALSANSISATVWKHYTWIIKRERVELYVRNSSQTAASNVLIAFMQTPSTSNTAQAISEINTAHGASTATLPPNYSYYNNFNGVRFYWRGASSNNTNLANLSISYNTSGTLPVSWKNIKAEHINGNLFRINSEIMADADIETIEVESSTNGRSSKSVFSKTVTLHEGQVYNLQEIAALEDDVKMIRLKAVHTNGKISYSNWLQIQTPVEVSEIYHPQGSDQLFIRTKNGQPSQLTIYNADGRIVKTYTNINGSIMLTESGLISNRVYIFKLQTEDKFIVRKEVW
jgi:hypothetical protein